MKNRFKINRLIGTIGVAFMSDNNRGLRDPIWQAISVFVSILTFIVSFLFVSSDKKELIVIRMSMPYSYSDFIFPSEVFSVVDRKTGKEVKEYNVDYLFIKNSGKKAILSGDIIDPIRIKPGAETFAVVSCKDGVNVNGERGFIDLSWKKVGLVWEVARGLFNPGDVGCLAFYSRAIKSDGQIVFSSYEVSSRIADSKFRYFDSLSDYNSYSILPSWQWFLVNVTLDGWEVYIFLLLEIMLFVSTYVLAKAACLFKQTKIDGAFILVAILLLSTGSAEVLTSFTRLGISMVHPISWPVLGVHILTIGVFLFERFQ